MGDKKKTMISWIMYAISVILAIVQIGISFSEASQSDAELKIVAIAMSIIGVINLILLIWGTILFVKNVSVEKGKTSKVVGIVLRVLVLIPILLITVIWVIGFFADLA